MVHFFFFADGVLNLGINDFLPGLTHLVVVKFEVFHELVNARSTLSVWVEWEVVAARAIAGVVAQVLLGAQLHPVWTHSILFILLFGLFEIQLIWLLVTLFGGLS